MGNNDNKPKKVKNIVKSNNDIFCKTKDFLDNLKNNYRAFSDILNDFAEGSTRVELRKRYLQSMVDETWVRIVEDTLPSIDVIIRHPGGGLVDEEEVKPIELTRKVTSKSVIHLSQHTDLINEIKDDGKVMPAKLLNVFNEESMLTYENKFINTLIVRLFSFVMLRYDRAVADSLDGMNTQFIYSQDFQTGETKNKISITLETTENPKDTDEIKNYLYTTDLWRRVVNVSEWCKSLMSSQFVKEMGKNYVHPPIMRTNKLLKNVDFRQCLSLWEFLESYENTGYETKVHESVEDIDENFLDDFYKSVVAQYIVFQNEIGNKFVEDKTFEERDISNINAHVVDSLADVKEEEYALVDNGVEEIDRFLDEREEDIDFAIRVALAADKVMYSGDDYVLQPKINIIYKYNYSYQARLILAENPTQDYYTEIKNKLLSYTDIKSKISWKHELFTYKKDKCARLICKGKTLHIFLPLKPSLYIDTKYNPIDNTEKDPELGFELKITSNRQVSHALELIDVVMANKEITPLADYVFTDYHLKKHTVEEMCKMKPPLVKRIGIKETVEVQQVLPPVKNPNFKYHYIYSFIGRLIMAQDPAQAYYSEIKNELLAHENVKAHVSWKHEQFSAGRVKICRLRVKGKTLCVYLPLDPSAYVDSNFKVYDVSESSTDEDFPLMIKLNSIKNTKFAMELINNILDLNNLKAMENPRVIDYHMDYQTPDELCNANPPQAKKVVFNKKPKPEMIKKKFKIVRNVGSNNVEMVHSIVKEVPKQEEQVIVKEVIKRIEEHVNIERYNMSHIAKLIRAQYPTQDYYTEIKNKLMSFEGLNNRISWHHEIFWYGENTIAKFVIKGKTLNVFLPLNPTDYLDSKYKYEDASLKKSYENLPFQMKISSPRKAKHVIELIDNIALDLHIKEKEQIKFVDYHKAYKTIDQLLESNPPLAKIRANKKENKSSDIKKIQIRKSKYLNSFIGNLFKSGKANIQTYSNLKNNFLAYKGIKCGEAWSHEEYLYKDDVLFELEMQGKTLILVLHEDYLLYTNTKYHIKAYLDENKEVVLGKGILELTSKRAYQHALELISIKASSLDILKGEVPNIDYRKLLKEDKELQMLRKPLIKIVKKVNTDEGKD